MAKRYMKWALLGATVATMYPAGIAVSGEFPPVFVPPSVGVELPVFIPPVDEVEFSDEITEEIARRINAAASFCASIPAPEYLVDCLGDALGQIAHELPTTGDYAEARRAIDQASRKLRKLARENAAPDLPRGVVRGRGENAGRSTSSLTPVRSDRLAAVNREALTIIEEAETILLRSAEASTLRKVHYQTIAAAFGSNKVLLRST